MVIYGNVGNVFSTCYMTCLLIMLSKLNINIEYVYL